MICRTNRWYVDEVFNVESIMIHDDRLNVNMLSYNTNFSISRNPANRAPYNECKAWDARLVRMELNLVSYVSWSSAVVSRRGLTVTGSGGMRNIKSERV